MKPFILLLMIITLPLHSFPQARRQCTLIGRILDKDGFLPLPGATVSLLYKNDSSIIASTTTGDDGKFMLKNLEGGFYLLAVSYIGYRTNIFPVLLSNIKNDIDVKDILMQRTGLTLGIIEIMESRPPVNFRKDTIEFNASAFKTRDNAVVAELLKKIPGVQLKSDGSILALGSNVIQILVDGKPFMGNNSRVTIENIPAEIIDKVQIVDFQNEQDKFSGVKGNESGKVINITTRKKSRNKWLGSSSFGVGTSERFGFKSSLNKFQDDQQLAMILNGNNVNNLNLFDGISKTAPSNEGFSREWNAGFHYDGDIGDKVALNASYNLVNRRTEAINSSTRQNILSDTSFYYNQNLNSTNKGISHAFAARLNYTIDSMQSILATFNFNPSQENYTRLSQYKSLNNLMAPINDGNVSNISHGHTEAFSGDIMYGKKFKKHGRSFSTLFMYQHSGSYLENLNNSVSTFYGTGGNIYSDSINQMIYAPSKTWSSSLHLLYTEPVSNNFSLQFNYSIEFTDRSSEKSTFDYNAYKGLYDVLNDSLSNHFSNSVTTHRVGTSLYVQKGHFEYKIGANFQSNQMASNNISINDKFKKVSFNLFPTASFTYVFQDNKRLQFLYSGSTQQPDVSQLQPVPDNSNPLYVRLGNPNLKPSFLNFFSASYNAFNSKTMHSLFASFRMVITKNKIVYANWLDSLGRQVSQAQNVTGAYNTNGEITYALPIGNRMKVSTTSSMSLIQDVTLTNGVKGNLFNSRLAQILDLDYSLGELADAGLHASFDYNTLRYSLQQNNSPSYANYSLAFDGSIKLPKNFIAGMDVYYVGNAGRSASYNREMILLNAHVAKSLFKNRAGLVKISGFDLLKQNQSIKRIVGENYFEDVRSNVLQRFFLISFSYYLR